MMIWFGKEADEEIKRLKRENAKLLAEKREAMRAFTQIGTKTSAINQIIADFRERNDGPADTENTE